MKLFFAFAQAPIELSSIRLILCTDIVCDFADLFCPHCNACSQLQAVQKSAVRGDWRIIREVPFSSDEVNCEPYAFQSARCQNPNKIAIHCLSLIERKLTLVIALWGIAFAIRSVKGNPATSNYPLIFDLLPPFVAPDDPPARSIIRLAD